jgi:outer membrane protein OmpA-like peptidoglycan-associated protein/opacity protein-like surface antigen
LKRKIIAISLLVICLAAVAGASDYDSKIGLGLRGPVFAPLFKGSRYLTRDNQSSFQPFMMGWDGAFEFKYGVPRTFLVNLSIAYLNTYAAANPSTDQSFKINSSNNATTKLTGLQFGLVGQYFFLSEGNVQPYLLLGGGLDSWKLKAISGSSKFNFTDLGGKAGAGINFWITENITLDLQARGTMDLGTISSSGDMALFADSTKIRYRPFNGYLEPSLGLTYFFGGKRDSDKDGVPDKWDQCPDTPIGALVDQYGCPLDSDNDGVYDGLDKCPDTPKGCVVDITGCPLDTDKDGVCDGLDKCPDTPPNVNVDVRGCPLDTDGDGVPDYEDKQANTPKGAVVDANGVALDGDNDGVPDGIDKCPDTPAGIAVDEFGCPKAKALTAKLLLYIQYESGSFEPDQPTKATLDELVETMKAYPKLNVQVNGYTDNLGSASSNLKISQRRADAIKDYLVGKGVSAVRITSTGYGKNPDFFIGDNSTADGRAKNRRIEIVPVTQ